MVDGVGGRRSASRHSALVEPTDTMSVILNGVATPAVEVGPTIEHVLTDVG